MTQKLFYSFILLTILIFPAQAEKFDRGIKQETFVPKGQWIGGMNISYSEHTNTNYKFLVIEGWNGKGYNLKVSPFVGYAFANNMAAGGRFEYTRSLLRIDKLSLNLGDDMSFDLKDIYQLNHVYYGTGFFRSYINLGSSKRFGLFNDAQLTFGGGQGKIVNGKGESLTGTYEQTYDLKIGMSPGLVAFISDNAAVEVSIGVLGFNFKWIDQTTNQIIKGSRRSSSANFKINLFSIGLGMAFYL